MYKRNYIYVATSIFLLNCITSINSGDPKEGQWGAIVPS